MKNKIILIINIIIISVVINFIIQIFVWPHLSTSPFLAKYQLNEKDKKTIIINKTEKITVKEDFSLTKSAEKIIPAVVRIYFLPKSATSKNEIKLDAQNNSGVILSGDGVIATTLPKFDLSDKIIKVFLSDGKEFIAEIKNEDIFNEILILFVKIRIFLSYDDAC